MMKKSLLNLFSGLLLTATAASAQMVIVPDAPRVNAKGYVLMDFHSGKVIAASNEHEELAPASLTKIMTSYVIGQELKNGRLALDDKATVSRNAWARNFPGSSLMFIEVGEKIAISDLYRGLVIQSGNDASVALAEHVAGSETAFVQLMNNWARQIGMTSTHFTNPHGLDSDGKHTTALDMAKLSRALIRDIPDQYPLYSERSFEWTGITQQNRNKLLWDKSLNVDGIKTGYTADAGFSLVTSATEDDMRLITVVMGTPSEQARMDESRRLLQYGFRFFETNKQLNEGETLENARIWQGQVDYVPAGVYNDVYITLPTTQMNRMSMSYEIDSALTAPIAKGDSIGTVTWTVGEEVVEQRPIIALEAVERGGLVKQLLDTVRQFIDSLKVKIFG
ncbi:D-alanyl-D-alanine carboxypeptidase [Endozoicomonas montiporae]|uniref:serine-type D-Ala-D-Ala carboxypeptidase n=2 Tax=Endozoicomonas montiporae TaxID=1027273 RepID=A0A081N4N0_9GAMM|nr:D-alanyl-D-alanine carboxypeptidase family protein [Endozoicomonas montiporae]AMO57720.1 D-alanyl-D-alanine carboxypeptidase [Endozoicomonas montiporae CL-33]KEQ13403.1 D-alanyl-D-alanine carboxypeptidase [Endozoicomonas montiporae]